MISHEDGVDITPYIRLQEEYKESMHSLGFINADYKIRVSAKYLIIEVSSKLSAGSPEFKSSFRESLVSLFVTLPEYTSKDICKFNEDFLQDLKKEYARWQTTGTA